MADIKIANLTAKTTWADTDILIIEDGADTKKMTVATFKDLLGTYTDWVPTLYGITKGTGGTVVARYIKIGKFIHFNFIFTFGTGSAMGDAAFSLPVTNKTNLTTLDGAIYDTGSTKFTMKAFLYNGNCSLAVSRLPGTYIEWGTALSPTVPMTWAVGDQIVISGSYEAA